MLLFEQDKHLMLFTGAFGCDKIGTLNKNGKLWEMFVNILVNFGETWLIWVEIRTYLVKSC